MHICDMVDRIQCDHESMINNMIALREKPSQINVILQQKLPAGKLSAICTVYKQ